MVKSVDPEVSDEFLEEDGPAELGHEFGFVREVQAALGDDVGGEDEEDGEYQRGYEGEGEVAEGTGDLGEDAGYGVLLDLVVAEDCHEVAGLGVAGAVDGALVALVAEPSVAVG